MLRNSFNSIERNWQHMSPTEQHRAFLAFIAASDYDRADRLLQQTLSQWKAPPDVNEDILCLAAYVLRRGKTTPQLRQNLEHALDLSKTATTKRIAMVATAFYELGRYQDVVAILGPQIERWQDAQDINVTQLWLFTTALDELNKTPESVKPIIERLAVLGRQVPTKPLADGRAGAQYPVDRAFLTISRLQGQEKRYLEEIGRRSENISAAVLWRYLQHMKECGKLNRQMELRRVHKLARMRLGDDWSYNIARCLECLDCKEESILLLKFNIATWQPYHWSQQILQFLQQLLKETHREFELNACLAMPLRICPPSEKHRIAQLIHTAESTPKN